MPIPRAAQLFLAVSLTAASVFAVASTARAQQPAEVWRLCVGGAGISPDQRITNCTTILSSSRETNENLAAARNNRGGAYHAQRRYDLALADFDEALRLNPKLANAWTGRGAVHAAQRNFARAISDHTRAIELNPQHNDAYYNRALAHQGAGDIGSAIADFRKSLEVNPADDDARRQLRELGVTP